MAKVIVSDIPELIDKLGGLAATGRAFSAEMNTVANWSARKRIPARLYLHHKGVLEERGIEAPLSLWGFAAPQPGQAA